MQSKPKAHDDMATRPTLLRVVVADDHHHVLPEIHLAIRRRVLPFSNVHIVHFDAHPDLSFSLDASIIMDPQRLYEALDESPSGIAEFLLPLVSAGHVNRITWIKPRWATQMNKGDAMDGIAIGRKASTDRLALSCALPHFVNDELYAPESELVPDSIKRWDFHVVELPCRLDLPSSPWILDVDLDYFSTWNPFRKDLEPCCFASEIDLLEEVFSQPRFQSTASSLNPSNRLREQKEFLAIMKRIEEERVYEHPESPTAAALIDSLAVFYDGDRSSVVALLERFLHLLNAQNEPTREIIWNGGLCFDLPHHESSQEEIEQLLSSFREFLLTAPSRPSIVTIATSVSDKFLPSHQLEFIKTRVLAILQDTLGSIQIDEVEYEAAE